MKWLSKVIYLAFWQRLPTCSLKAPLVARKCYLQLVIEILIGQLEAREGGNVRKVALHEADEVHGIIRRSSSFNTGRIEHLYTDQTAHSAMKLHYGDLTDSTCLVKIISQVRPTELYNLGAQSHVKVKFYQASTSEMFGKVQEIPQKETTPFYPRSPYGVAKVYGYWIVVNYREAYNMRDICDTQDHTSSGQDHPGATEGGEGVSEVGKNKATGDVLVKVNPRFYRPTEVKLVGEMVESDLDLMRNRPMA
ncbi:GMDS-like protein [Mya arenaria]|uniref:GDP-mannose 4,6-dehydratase n=1 Tax=Mya arenaria TaxID=6604 RepID=A0ABY7ENZ7_MYAAR|nr:GMDS-like protein [Mya arenaria]